MPDDPMGGQAPAPSSSALSLQQEHQDAVESKLTGARAFMQYKERLFRENPAFIDDGLITRAGWETLALGERLSIGFITDAVPGKGAVRELWDTPKGKKIVAYRCTVRVVAPGGRFAEADGVYTSEEHSGNSENSMAQMAAKRARAKAISIFFGGDVAEERKDDRRFKAQQRDGERPETIPYAVLLAQAVAQGVVETDDHKAFVAWVQERLPSTRTLAERKPRAFTAQESVAVRNLLAAVKD